MQRVLQVRDLLGGAFELLPEIGNPKILIAIRSNVQLLLAPCSLKLGLRLRGLQRRSQLVALALVKLRLRSDSGEFLGPHPPLRTRLISQGLQLLYQCLTGRQGLLDGRRMLLRLDCLFSGRHRHRLGCDELLSKGIRSFLLHFLLQPLHIGHPLLCLGGHHAGLREVSYCDFELHPKRLSLSFGVAVLGAVLVALGVCGVACALRRLCSAPHRLGHRL